MTQNQILEQATQEISAVLEKYDLAGVAVLLSADQLLTLHQLESSHCRVIPNSPTHPTSLSLPPQDPETRLAVHCLGYALTHLACSFQTLLQTGSTPFIPLQKGIPPLDSN